MALSPFAQKAGWIAVGAITVWILSFFRIDAFTGTEGREQEVRLKAEVLASENRILVRLNECREETRNDILSIGGRVDGIDREQREHETDRTIHQSK